LDTALPEDSFLVGHATHPDARMALALAAAQVDAQAARRPATARPPSLGLVYFSDHYAAQAQALHQDLRLRWPGVRWAGCAAVGVAASGVEYFDEPALVLMLCPLAEDAFQVFSGTRPLGVSAHTALVHAAPSTPDLSEIVVELSQRVATGYLFGGLVSSRAQATQIAEGVFDGGLSGVGFGAGVALISRVTQGCQPVGPERVITAAEGPLVLALDGRPALPCLLEDLGIGLDDPRKAMPVLRATLVGLTDADAALLGRGGQFGPDVRARHLIGLDPTRQAVAVAEHVEPGMRLAFSQRHTEAARRDLVRICSEIRDELDSTAEPAAGALDAAAAPRRILGAVYVSCNGRGGPHFGAPSAELKIVQRALGDVPLAGFFAAGEIARCHLYGYTGVLTVFTSA
jgi:small ligand-binding sensory domain FIST